MKFITYPPVVGRLSCKEPNVKTIKIFKWIRLEEYIQHEDDGWILVSIRMSVGAYVSYLMMKEEIHEEANDSEV